MEERPPLERVPGRKTPAQGVKVSLGEPTIILLTVCTKDRLPWLAHAHAHVSLRDIWHQSDAWSVGYYVLMPDHLHLFCAPRDLRYTIEKWVKYWKSQFTREHMSLAWQWQRGSFHHRIRDSRDFEEKWIYVQENPLRKKLVTDSKDWPYQGVIHELRW